MVCPDHITPWNESKGFLAPIAEWSFNVRLSYVALLQGVRKVLFKFYFGQTGDFSIGKKEGEDIEQQDRNHNPCF